MKEIFLIYTQAYLGDIEDSVPDGWNKVNICNKASDMNFLAS